MERARREWESKEQELRQARDMAVVEAQERHEVEVGEAQAEARGLRELVGKLEMEVQLLQDQLTQDRRESPESDCEE